MSDNRKKILDYMLQKPNATRIEVQQKFNISSTSVVQHHIVSLRKDGLLPAKFPVKIEKAIKQKELLLKVIKETIKELNDILDKSGA